MTGQAREAGNAVLSEGERRTNVSLASGLASVMKAEHSDRQVIL